MAPKNGGMLRRSKTSMIAAATAALGVITLSSAKRTDRGTIAPPSRQGSITNKGGGGAMSTRPLPPSPSDNIASNLSLGPSLSSPNAPRVCNFSCLDTSGWNEVCGTDGVTYTSACDLEETACEQHKALRPSITKKLHNGPCIDVQEEDGGVIEEKGDATIFLSPLSCDFECLDANEGGLGFTSLCGTDGVTYPSICMLEKGACRAKKQGMKDVLIDYTGPCEEEDFEEGEMSSSHDEGGSSPIITPLHLRSGATSPQLEMKYYV